MLVSGQTRNQISFRVVFQNMFQPIREQEKTYCPMGIQAADFFGGVKRRQQKQIDRPIRWSEKSLTVGWTSGFLLCNIQQNSGKLTV